MIEYDLYLPSKKIDAQLANYLRNTLRRKFGGVTYMNIDAKGEWEHAGVVHKDKISIARVLSTSEQDEFLIKLQADLIKLLDEKDLLILKRVVSRILK